MSKNDRTNKNYTEEFKLNAVKLYLDGNRSYQTIANEVGLRSPTQLKNWVNQYRDGISFEDKRGKHSINRSMIHGFQKTKFISIEEERDYLKAQVEYLKKRYPNILGEG